MHEAAAMKKLIRKWLGIVTTGPESAWLECAAEELVMRLPFAPPGVVSELHGSAQALQALSTVWKIKERFDWHDVVTRATEDPELFVVTARSDVLLRSGTQYANTYVILIRVRGGKIVEHVEYFNPLPVIEAFTAADR